MEGRGFPRDIVCFGNILLMRAAIYPWRVLRMGGVFRAPFTADEMLYPKLATRRRKMMYVAAYTMGRYNLAFAITREKKGLLIKRIR